MNDDKQESNLASAVFYSPRARLATFFHKREETNERRKVDSKRNFQLLIIKK